MHKTMFPALALSLLIVASFAEAATRDPFAERINQCIANPRADFASCASSAARAIGSTGIEIKRSIAIGDENGDPTDDEVCVDIPGGSDGDCSLYECNGSGMTSDVCSIIGYCFDGDDGSTCVYDAEE